MVCSVTMMDLGIFLPATIAACVGLVRGAELGQKVLYLVVGWFALTGLAVAAMAVAMYVNDGPNASGVVTALMVSLGLLFAVLAPFSTGRSSRADKDRGTMTPSVTQNSQR
jgi:peptidoglycan/LPS O-acetylase OafA/YrhL